MNFRVGQTVKLVNNNNMAADIGATAKIFKIDKSYLYVKWKTHYNHQGDGGYYPRTFKPVRQKGEQLMFAFMQTDD